MARPRVPRIYRHGNKYWYDFWVKKVRHRDGFDSEEEALEAALKILASPTSRSPKVDRNIRLLEYGEYVYRNSRVKQATKDTALTNLRAHLKSLHHTKVRELTVFHVRMIVDEMEAKTRRVNGIDVPYAPLTIKIVVGVLSKILTNAVSDQLLDINPVSQLAPDHHKPFKKTRVERMLTADEAFHLLDVAGAEDPKWRRMFALALFGGLRNSEIRKLTRAQIDFDTEMIHAQGTKTEASKGWVRMSADLVRELRPCEHLFGLELVVPNEIGTEYDLSNLTGKVRALTARAGFPGVTLHHLRHNFATVMYEAGVPIHQAMRQMRHDDERTYKQTYVHDTGRVETRDEAVAAIDAYYTSGTRG